MPVLRNVPEPELLDRPYPVMSNIPFNPLDKLSLARAVAKALLERPCHPLPPAESFAGAGIYAVYYTGRFPPYEKIAALNREGKFLAPIYVGKATPQGGRRGGFELGGAAGTVLYNRLREHAETIEQAENLDLADFYFRCLVVDDIWIPLGEQLLIQSFSPVWNRVIDGFGNHDPGAGRQRQQRSPWDVLHPGRAWARRLQPNRKSAPAVLGEIEGFMRTWEPTHF